MLCCWGVIPIHTSSSIALAPNVVDHASMQAAEIFPLSNLVVLAAPMQAILLLNEMDHLHPGNAVVLDLGSTKSHVMTAMASLSERFDPLGGHPMCGKEQSSLVYARLGLYQAAPFVLCRLGRTLPGRSSWQRNSSTRSGRTRYGWMHLLMTAGLRRPVIYLT